MTELSLYPIQEQAKQAISDAFRSGYRKVMLYAPCAFGKTELALAMMEATAMRDKKASMIMDRIILCDQTSKRMDKYNIPHGINQSQNERYDPSMYIQICSAQTLEKRGTLPATDLMIIDEAHDKRRMMMEFIDNSNVFTVGLSASPVTDGLSKHYETVINATTIEKQIEEGRAVPLKVYIGKAADMKGAKKTAGEWQPNEVVKRGREIIGDVLTEWERLTFEHFGKPEKTIVFTANVNHGDELAAEFQAAGYNFVNISYKDDSGYKQEVLDEFYKPDSKIIGVMATDLLTKGADFPDVKIGVSCRPFKKSFAKHIQQMGRLQRTFINKDYGLWLCHSGNFLRFWSDWEDLYKNGVRELKDGKETPRKEPTERQKEAAKCPQCHALWKGGTSCASCGYEIPKNTNVVSTPGELVELETKMTKKADQQSKQEFYSELLDYVYEHNFKKPEGFAAHKFKTKYGVWPDKMQKTRKPYSKETASWVKSQFTRQYYSKKKSA